MRWNHPSLGTVSPGEFISAAERCGFINERWRAGAARGRPRGPRAAQPTVAARLALAADGADFPERGAARWLRPACRPSGWSWR